VRNPCRQESFVHYQKAQLQLSAQRWKVSVDVLYTLALMYSSAHSYEIGSFEATANGSLYVFAQECFGERRMCLGYTSHNEKDPNQIEPSGSKITCPISSVRLTRLLYDIRATLAAQRSRQAMMTIKIGIKGLHEIAVVDALRFCQDEESVVFEILSVS
jgi:hypothetical protein